MRKLDLSVLFKKKCLKQFRALPENYLTEVTLTVEEKSTQSDERCHFHRHYKGAK